jgi:hypothetical protein
VECKTIGKSVYKCGIALMVLDDVQFEENKGHIIAGGATLMTKILENAVTLYCTVTLLNKYL